MFRYIYLECDHRIELKKMDEWVNRKDESEEPIRQIRFPSCPQCGKAIRQCFRYGDQIKAFYLDLIGIKWVYVKDETIRIVGKVKQALNKWKPQIAETEDDDRIKSTFLRLTSLSNCNNLSSDQRWDLIYRIQLLYLMSCIVNDSKKKYAMKKEEFTLNESVEHIVCEISSAFLYMEKNSNSGFGYYFDLFVALKRLDLYRQYYAVNSLSERLPKSNRVNQKQLEKVAHLLNNNQRLTDAEENFLVNWFEEKSAFYEINLTSSFNRANVQLVQRLDMSKETWYKCTRSFCEAVFSKTCDKKCPECLDELEA